MSDVQFIYPEFEDIVKKKQVDTYNFVKKVFRVNNVVAEEAFRWWEGQMIYYNQQKVNFIILQKRFKTFFFLRFFQ